MRHLAPPVGVLRSRVLYPQHIVDNGQGRIAHDNPDDRCDHGGVAAAPTAEALRPDCMPAYNPPAPRALKDAAFDQPYYDMRERGTLTVC